MTTDDYVIKVISITSRAPKQMQYWKERQTIDNILHFFKVQDMVLDDKNL